MKEIKTGGPAFPDGSTNSWGHANNPGMTLRDYFAAKAMPSTLRATWVSLRERGERVENVYDIAAMSAYEMSDAMLRAREES